MTIIVSIGSGKRKGNRTAVNPYPLGWGWWPVRSEGAREIAHDYPRSRVPVTAACLTPDLTDVK